MNDPQRPPSGPRSDADTIQALLHENAALQARVALLEARVAELETDVHHAEHEAWHAPGW